MTTHRLDPSTVAQRPYWPILRVLGWEFVRSLNAPSLLLVLAGLLLPWALFNATMGVSQDAFKSENYYPSFFALTSLVGLVMAYKGQSGVRRFLSTRPLSNTFMFIWLLATPVACAVLIFAVSNVVVQVAYGLDWPWARPILWLAFFVILTKCAYWRVMIGWDWEILGAIGVGLLAAGCFAMVQGAFDSKTIELHRPFTGLEIGMLGIATLITLVVGYRSLCEIRISCGDVDSETWFANRYGKLDTALIGLASISTNQKPPTCDTVAQRMLFKNSQAALDWMAWRQVGMAAIFFGGVTGLLLLVPQTLKNVDFSKFPPSLTAFHSAGLFEFAVPMFTVCCAEAGAAIGFLTALMMRVPYTTRQSFMSAFHGTKPVSTAELFRLLSRAMLRYCVMAWLILTVLVWTLPIIVYASTEPAPPGGSHHLGSFLHGVQSNSFYDLLGHFSFGAWMLYGLLLMWTFAGLFLVGVLFGNDKVASIVAAGVIGFLVVVLFLTLMLPNHKDTIITAAWTIGGLLGLAATLGACHRTWKSGMLVKQQLLFAMTSWLLLATFAMHLCSPGQAVGAVMLSSLIGLGVVAGPSALAASRNR